MSRKPGRKMGVWEIWDKDHALRLADVEYRFDTSDGEFSAEYEEVKVRAYKLQEVKDQIWKAVRDRAQVTWKPMIYVEVQERDWDSLDSRQTLSMDFKAMEVSIQEFDIPARWCSEAHRAPLWRAAYVTDKGVFKSSSRAADTASPEEVAHLIPYTPEVWAALNRINQGIVELRERLAGLVKDAGALQAIGSGGLRLLTEAPDHDVVRKKGKKAP